MNPLGWFTDAFGTSIAPTHFQVPMGSFNIYYMSNRSTLPYSRISQISMAPANREPEKQRITWAKPGQETNDSGKAHRCITLTVRRFVSRWHIEGPNAWPCFVTANGNGKIWFHWKGMGDEAGLRYHGVQGNVPPVGGCNAPFALRQTVSGTECHFTITLLAIVGCSQFANANVISFWLTDYDYTDYTGHFYSCQLPWIN